MSKDKVTNEAVAAVSDDNDPKKRRNERAMAELKQRAKLMAVILCIAVICVGIAFLLFKEPPVESTEVVEVDGELNGHSYVDLGLSVNWADSNIGAEADTLFGDYFAWGEIEPKERYDEDNYTYIGHMMTSIERKRNHDAAANGFGRGWRMPTLEEVTELAEKCTWELEATDGRCGYRATGPNGNSIFIPADSASDGTKPIVTLWSSRIVEGDSLSAYALQVVDTMHRVVSMPAYRGLQVRAVTR